MSEKPSQLPPGAGADLLETAGDWHAQLLAQPHEASLRTQFEQWLARDLRHRLAYADIRAAEFAVEQFDDAAQTMALPSRRSVRRPARTGWFAGMALSMLVLFAVWQGARPWDALRSDLRTAEGEVKQFDLPDGSQAWLAGDSAIALDFSDGRRDLTLLRGEATFDVQHDPSRPFVVHADHTTATAVGTRYAVSHRGRKAVVVEVEQGRVAVAREGAAAPVLVDAGMQIRSDANGLPDAPVPLASGALDWRRGLLVLEDTSMAEAATRLDAYIPGRVVVIGDPTARVSAAIAIGDADAALEAIAAREGLQVSRVPGLVMVLH